MMLANTDLYIVIAERLGVPVMCLVALAIAVWRIGVYALKHIARPLAERHIKYLDKAGEAMEKNSTSLIELSGNMSRVAKTLDKIEDKVDSLENKHQLLWTEVKGMSVKADKVVVMQPKDGQG